jgi:hypothetical protein
MEEPGAGIAVRNGRDPQRQHARARRVSGPWILAAGTTSEACHDQDVGRAERAGHHQGEAVISYLADLDEPDFAIDTPVPARGEGRAGTFGEA